MKISSPDHRTVDTSDSSIQPIGVPMFLTPFVLPVSSPDMPPTLPPCALHLLNGGGRNNSEDFEQQCGAKPDGVEIGFAPSPGNAVQAVVSAHIKIKEGAEGKLTACVEANS
jgi:hypothetical protein